MSSRHVGLYLPSLNGGGAERVMVSLANGFADRGIRVDLVLANASGPFLDQVAQNVRIVDLRCTRVSLSLPRLVNYLLTERPPILLSALDHANVIAQVAVSVSRTGTRLILSQHNSIRRLGRYGGIKSFFLFRAMALAYPMAYRTVAVSKGVADDLREIMTLPEEKIATIYNPIVSDNLLKQSFKPLDDFPDGCVILATGRLTKYKDYPTLLKAFSLVRGLSNARLVILGEGELRAELEMLADELGISDRIIMPGFVSNPYAWMRNADLFVLSSSSEGLPTVLVEAMACGTPVVSTSCPSGPAEILEAGKWGYLVPVGDYEALAKAMIEALKAPPKLGAAERALDFSVTKALDAYEECLWASGSQKKRFSQ